MLVGPEADGSYLLLFQRALRIYWPASVSRSRFAEGGIHRRVTRRSSPPNQTGKTTGEGTVSWPAVNLN